MKFRDLARLTKAELAKAQQELADAEKAFAEIFSQSDWRSWHSGETGEEGLCSALGFPPTATSSPMPFG